MLNQINIKNFGPLAEIDWPNLGPINLIIGGNGSGKTFLLKSLYCTVRTLEEYLRGDDKREATEILAEKLRWTFQAEKIGDLVSKGANAPLSVQVQFDGKRLKYSFGKDTTKQISIWENETPKRDSHSIFLPAKEVLSIIQIILKSREDKEFGFDDTYYDLARALQIGTTPGRNYALFAQSRKRLEDLVHGRVWFDEISKRWHFIDHRQQKFSIGTTSEGTKKIAILDTLLGNRFLDTRSVIFIDEPESALHPTAISSFLEIVELLAESGIQFFIAGHSYFLIKKLYLIAQEKKMSIPVISEDGGVWHYDDLKNGMPENPIVNESIRLYKEEVDLNLR